MNRFVTRAVLFGIALPLVVFAISAACPSVEDPLTPEPTATVVRDATPGSTPVSGPCPTASMSGFALDLFNAQNSERVARGLPALSAHGCLVYVAKLRSDDMASRNYLSHTSPEGETAFSLMDANGIPYGWAAENLARNNYPNDETVAIAIQDFMASQGHRDNILNTNFTHAGVAMAEDDSGMKYYTTIYIGPP